MVEARQPPRFDPDDTEFLDYLEEHGYAIVRDVAPPNEIHKLHDAYWEYTAEVWGAQRGQPSTWENGLGANPATGIIGGHGFGQSRFLWELRTLPRVRAAFEFIWETTDLLSSYDGGNVFRPTHSRPDWRTKGGWWHCDQNGTLAGRSGRVCVQVSLCFARGHTPAH